MALKRWTRVGFVEGPENRSGGDCDRIAVHFADEPDGGGLSSFGVRCLAAEEHRVYPTGLSPFRDDHKMRPRIFILAYLQSKSWSFHLSLRMQRCDGEKKKNNSDCSTHRPILPEAAHSSAIKHAEQKHLGEFEYIRSCFPRQV